MLSPEKEGRRSRDAHPFSSARRSIPGGCRQHYAERPTTKHEKVAVRRPKHYALHSTRPVSLLACFRLRASAADKYRRNAMGKGNKVRKKEVKKPKQDKKDKKK